MRHGSKPAPNNRPNEWIESVEDSAVRRILRIHSRISRACGPPERLAVSGLVAVRLLHVRLTVSACATKNMPLAARSTAAFLRHFILPQQRELPLVLRHAVEPAGVLRTHSTASRTLSPVSVHCCRHRRCVALLPLHERYHPCTAPHRTAPHRTAPHCTADRNSNPRCSRTAALPVVLRVLAAACSTQGTRCRL